MSSTPTAAGRSGGGGGGGGGGQPQSPIVKSPKSPAAAPTPSNNNSPLALASSGHDGRLASLVAASIPALQLQTFVFFFPQLVSDPVETLSRPLLAATALIQVASTVAFLPVAGSSRASPRRLRPGEKKKPGSAADGGPHIAVATLLSLILTLIATPPLHAAMVLFGAPFLTHLPHTFLCSLHLSLLAFFPLFYTRGADAAAWRALAGLQCPFDETVGALAGALLGGWLGAVPIPLDWDRDWQRWPVTVVAGVYAGYAVGSYAGRTVLRGWRF